MMARQAFRRAMVLMPLLLVALAHAAVAQQVPSRRALPPALTPAAPAAVLGASVDRSVIELPLNKAHVLRFDQRIGNIVLGNETVADIHIDPENPQQVFVVSKGIGATNVFFMGTDKEIVRQMEVRVTADHEELKSALKKLLPEEEIEVSVIRDSVFLGGNVRSTAAASSAMNIAQRFVANPANVHNMLKVTGSQQVILKVRVAEMDRIIRKNLQVNQSVKLLSTYGDLTFSTVSPSTTLAAFASGQLTNPISGLGQSTFSALERQGLAKTLTEPTLTALSGESASFLSGGELPVPIGVDQNGNAIIEFREFGIRLEFTPVVLDKGRINLRVLTEISAVDTSTTVTLSNLTVNGFTTNRAESTIDLPSGGTLMIAGLLQDGIADTINGMPFLKDVPVLGALFRSTEFQRDESELVITVTAYLAKPADSGAKIALPTDGFEPASDIDIYLLGRLHRTYGKGERPFWQDPVKGPFGYIMR